MSQNLPQPDLSPLFNYLEQYYPLSEKYCEAYYKIAYPIKIKKNKYLLSPIDRNACLYFLVKGTIRGFVRENSIDITTWFCFGNEIIGAIRHPEDQGRNSIEFLQALEDSELICIPYILIEELYRNFAEANIIGRRILALQFHAASERSMLARIPKATERYRRFMEKMPKEVIQNMPLRYLASYLGMRLETLCRIRCAGADGTWKRKNTASIQSILSNNLAFL
ncbi:Crp/Fnr family transcriptional regulator [Pedobacter sp. HDW13]|uniref:Crp/Fnr family transcriptional regulator n=1 Tax=Pedobacter sp. HDW13 TaxID=2714940 RepID=UPI00140BC39D|nr:Crp/Fnr family transcriptional regulator [Pedobacter sp. HDW13]QIL37988.1 Crp/Fnr family transcriptional regulator [Pedobacter sp. HDW13]